MLIIIFWQSEAYKSNNNIILFIILLLLTWLIPVLFFALSLKRGWIDNIDATRRQERYATYTLAGLGWLAGLFIAQKISTPDFFPYSSPDTFFPYYFLLFLMIALLVIITFFWKISVHAATITMFYLLLNHFAGWRFFWLLPLPLLVMWARWQEKNHNILQLAAGTLLAFLLFIIFLGFSFYSRGGFKVLFTRQEVVLGQGTKPNPSADVPTVTPVSTDFALLINKINVNAPIRDVDGSNEKNYLPNILKGIGHYQHQVLPQVTVDGSFPGQGGNIFLFGHSQIPGGDTSHYKGIFNDLGNLDLGDKIVVYYQNQVFRYAVFESKMVEKTALEYLSKTEDETLTLMTCWPLGLDIKRLIVRARKVD